MQYYIFIFLVYIMDNVLFVKDYFDTCHFDNNTLCQSVLGLEVGQGVYCNAQKVRMKSNWWKCGKVKHIFINCEVKYNVEYYTKFENQQNSYTRTLV